MTANDKKPVTNTYPDNVDKVLYWSLVGTEGVLSHPHIDADGVCTWIFIVAGYKIFAFPKFIDGNWPTHEEIVNPDPKNWIYVVLGPGSRMSVQLKPVLILEFNVQS